MKLNIPSTRLSPDEITGRDRGRLDQLATLMNQKEVPALIGDSGEKMELPTAIYHLLKRLVMGMREGKTMLLVPENEVMTTQAAADYLGVSRPHFVKLLEDGEIPHHTVGTHRRVHFSDLVEYGRVRDKQRRKTLDKLTKLLSEKGVYDPPAQE